MGSGYSKMKKQARLMEAQMQTMQTSLKQTECEGSSAQGLVKVVLDGEKNIKRITIQPACVDQQDIEGLQDLIISAFQEAQTKASELSKSYPGLPF
jgi:DNA-binding YbaB/EbfC family protein